MVEKGVEDLMKAFLLFVWNFFDPFYYSCTRLTYITGEGDNIFRIRLTKYKGRSIILSDGTKINKNDMLVKIHLHNIRLLMESRGMKSELRKAKLIYRHVEQSLPGVETYIRDHFDSCNVKGIVGITSIYKGSERLGFEIIDIINPFYRWFKIISFFPIAVLAQDRTPIRQILKEQRPNYLFMSIKQLRSKYRQED